MKLGIMQPYFFPYLGYFSLINETDKWIVFDTVQYIEHGWVNRNRIIHATKPESTYITIPLQMHSQKTCIKDITISQNEQYIEKILGQIKTSYKRRAPYFKEIYGLVENCLDAEKNSLVDLNVYSLRKVCDYLSIDFDYQIFSKMDLAIKPVNDAGEWALNISEAMNADEYINPPGGKGLFDGEKFAKANIKLKFIENNLPTYNQKKSAFISGLSILDVMMFNSPEETVRMIENITCSEI